LGFNDRFIDHDNQARQLASQGLDALGIERDISARLAMLTGKKSIAG
jgi:deoxyxylulose-5-phosphate synthase